MGILTNTSLRLNVFSILRDLNLLSFFFSNLIWSKSLVPLLLEEAIDDSITTPESARLYFDCFFSWKWSLNPFLREHDPGDYG